MQQITEQSRRAFISAALAGGVGAGALAVGRPAAAAPQAGSGAVRREKVRFTSGGETITGTLFRLADARRPLPGVVVAGSWTTVKEQMAELYAAELAERGFTTLAFDFRNFGESGGKVREHESAARKRDDIRGAAAWLARRPEVKPGGVGGLGVCASAGYMAHAIAAGSDIKSFGTVAAWLHDPASARTLYADRYDRFLADGRSAHAEFERTGQVRYVPAFSQNDRDAAMQMDGPGYYGDPARGAVPQWNNRFAQMGWVEWLNFDALAPAASISVPTLMFHSDQSALPANVRKFHSALKGPKRLYWGEGLHLDFYDRPQLVSESMDVLGVHFARTLA